MYIIFPLNVNSEQEKLFALKFDKDTEAKFIGKFFYILKVPEESYPLTTPTFYFLSNLMINDQINNYIICFVACCILF